MGQKHASEYNGHNICSNEEEEHSRVAQSVLLPEYTFYQSGQTVDICEIKKTALKIQFAAGQQVKHLDCFPLFA